MKRILFVMTLPPPVHGSAVMSQYIKDSKVINNLFVGDYINISTSRSMHEIGKRNPIKLWRLVAVLMTEIWLLLTRKYDFCYLAITCHGKGFLKDAPFVLLCKLFRKKIIIHQHNKGMSRDLDRYPYRWLLPLVYKNAKVILLSWKLYPDVEKIVPKENVYICPNGIPEIGYEYQERHNDVPRLLFLSNLIESKGVVVLLDALKILRDKRVSFVCDFVGGETTEINRARFERKVKTRGLNDWVFFHGKKYGNEKAHFYENADVFVFPTFYENETFGLVNLEAMQYGLPIVTTNEGGIPDLVEHGVNGLICEKKDVLSLANAIQKLIDNPYLRERMGKIGIELYNQKYTLGCFEDRLAEILNCQLNDSIRYQHRV